ncbi:hypothetical protein FXO37_06343 [Capsicum annuum]|uniref:uncharacterized protein LOC107872141 n=1 Tax=Capsicum annuum TaxID=4072 RepID=UPI0007BF44C8|nr:uncharacterized protein LOC107872141 [Capsicum annuum]KAF3674544.1 hypothetical protein FXO37_06343 [Capsicum annuum]
MAKNLSERIASLSKKAEELYTLYDIIVALIIFTPGETIPFVWPNEAKAMASVLWYFSQSRDERLEGLVECETFLSHKLEEKMKNIRKIEQKIEEREMEIMFNKLYDGEINLNELDAREIKGLQKMFALIRAKLDEREKQLAEQSQSSQPPSILSNGETTIENNVDQSDNFYGGSASTSLVGGSSDGHGPIAHRDE